MDPKEPSNAVNPWTNDDDSDSDNEPFIPDPESDHESEAPRTGFSSRAPLVETQATAHGGSKTVRKFSTPKSLSNPPKNPPEAKGTQPSSSTKQSPPDGKGTQPSSSTKQPPPDGKATQPRSSTKQPPPGGKVNKYGKWAPS